MRSTLILNASYAPLSVVSSKKAVKLILNGKAFVESASPHVVKTSGNVELAIPYVIRLKEEIKQGRKARSPRYSRHGVLVRDNYTCAYCGNYANTIDHIIPQSEGGEGSYENCVAACERCNHKKSNKSLAQMGWTPNAKRVPPTIYSNMLNKVRHNEELFNTWIEYISWYDADAKAEKLKRQAQTKENV